MRSWNGERANSHEGAACSVPNYLLDIWVLANIADNLDLSLWKPKRKSLHSWQVKKYENKWTWKRLKKKSPKTKHKTLKCEKNRIRINSLNWKRVALTTYLSKLRCSTSSNYVRMLLSIKNKEKIQFSRHWYFKWFITSWNDVLQCQISVMLSHILTHQRFFYILPLVCSWPLKYLLLLCLYLQ